MWVSKVYHDSEEGQRYMTFYPITEWPYVAILDPRTGERLVTWVKLDAMTFCDLVTEFLSNHRIGEHHAKKTVSFIIVLFVFISHLYLYLIYIS